MQCVNQLRCIQIVHMWHITCDILFLNLKTMFLAYYIFTPVTMGVICKTFGRLSYNDDISKIEWWGGGNGAGVPVFNYIFP